jgi:hypothetical protein
MPPVLVAGITFYTVTRPCTLEVYSVNCPGFARKLIAELQDKFGMQKPEAKTEPPEAAKKASPRNRGANATTEENVRRFHDLRKQGESLAYCEKHACDSDTYRKWCWRFTHEHPIETTPKKVRESKQ